VITPSVTNVVFTLADPAAQRSGLLGYIRCSLGNALILDGITVRRTRTGRLALSFPARRDRAGIEHPIIRPTDDATRRQFEDAIFAALRMDRKGGGSDG
jgi:DNA-binding cell septation regulator SpoVG